jgi:hypothetical protein
VCALESEALYDPRDGPLVCDRVLPDVPLRQWVMSVPYERRRVLAAQPGDADADVAVVPLRSACAGVKACAVSAARARDGKEATETIATATAMTTTTVRVKATGDDGWLWTTNSAAPPAAVRAPGRMDWATLMHRVWG